MKKIVHFLLGTAMALCLTQAALAAEQPIRVQLDGKELAFTDAAPVVKSERTFVPFRAVFEAMGAEVRYGDGVVTAVRGGKTVKLTIGSVTATVEADGETESLTMDVEPFVDPAVSRTYIPIRFAAQALGARVGWDQDANTVVIVDAEKQLRAALEGKSFTCLEKLATRMQKYDQGIWDATVAMEGSVDVDALRTQDTPIKFTLPVSLTGTGTTEDGDKLDMTMKLTADTSAAIASLGEDSELAGLGILIAMAADGVTVSCREDLSAGKVYVNVKLPKMAAQLLGELSPTANTWYAIDLKSFEKPFEQMPIDWDTLTRAKDVDMETIFSLLLSTVSVNSAATSYAAFSAEMDIIHMLVGIFSDDAFVKSGNKYTSTVTHEDQDTGLGFTLKLSLTMKGDTVSAYDIEAALIGDDNDFTMIIDFKLGMDGNDKLSGFLKMDISADEAESFTADFTLSGGYKKGSTAPVVEPPADAEIKNLTEELDAIPA